MFLDYQSFFFFLIDLHNYFRTLFVLAQRLQHNERIVQCMTMSYNSKKKKKNISKRLTNKTTVTPKYRILTNVNGTLDDVITFFWGGRGCARCRSRLRPPSVQSMTASCCGAFLVASTYNVFSMIYIRRYSTFETDSGIDARNKHWFATFKSINNNRNRVIISLRAGYRWDLHCYYIPTPTTLLYVVRICDGNICLLYGFLTGGFIHTCLWFYPNTWFSKSNRNVRRNVVARRTRVHVAVVVADPEVNGGF